MPLSSPDISGQLAPDNAKILQSMADSSEVPLPPKSPCVAICSKLTFLPERDINEGLSAFVPISMVVGIPIFFKYDAALFTSGTVFGNGSKEIAPPRFL